MDEVYKELETMEGEGKIYRIAKAHSKATKDLAQIRQFKDGDGVVIWELEKIKDRWKGYFEMLLDEDNPRTVFEDGVQNEGGTLRIERREVRVALKRAKKGKAMGPDGIPVEVWKCMGEEGVDMCCLHPMEWCPHPVEWCPHPMEWCPHPTEWCLHPMEWCPYSCCGDIWRLTTHSCRRTVAVDTWRPTK